jgi:hypothetical protein
MEVNGVLDGSGDMVPGRMVLEGTDLDIAQRHPSGSAPAWPGETGPAGLRSGGSGRVGRC